MCVWTDNGHGHGQIIDTCEEMCAHVRGHVPGQMMDMCMVR